jgi:hypothetical protein
MVLEVGLATKNAGELEGDHIQSLLMSHIHIIPTLLAMKEFLKVLGSYCIVAKRSMRLLTFDE